MSEWKTCPCGEEFRSKGTKLCDSCKQRAWKKKIKFDEYYKLISKDEETK